MTAYPTMQIRFKADYLTHLERLAKAQGLRGVASLGRDAILAAYPDPKRERAAPAVAQEAPRTSKATPQPKPGQKRPQRRFWSNLKPR